MVSFLVSKRIMYKPEVKKLIQGDHVALRKLFGFRPKHSTNPFALRDMKLACGALSSRPLS